MAEEKAPQWAMATPAVVYMVGVACIGVFALLSGLTGGLGIPLIAVFLIGCGIPTMILGAIELRRGDILFGSINMVFGALIWFGIGFQLLVVGLGFAGPENLVMTGWLAAGTSLLFFLFLPNVAKVSKLVMVAFIVLGVGLALMAWGLIVPTPFGVFPLNVSGYCFLVFGLLVIYAGTVFITNTVYQAPKLPLP